MSWQTVFTAVLAALVSACAALLGVFLSNRAALARQKQLSKETADESERRRQHEREEAERRRGHERDEADAKRVHETRVEVYLEAADELVKANSLLGNYAQIDLATDHGSLTTGLHAAVAKVSLVGSPDTVVAARALAATFAVSHFRIMDAAGAIHAARCEVDNSQKLVNEYQKDINELLTRQRELLRNEGDTQERYDLLARALELANDSRRKFHDNTMEVRKKLLEEYKLFYAAIKPHIDPITAASQAAALSMRLDLGIETDTEAFAAQTQALQNQIHASVDQVFANMNQKYEE